MRARVVALMVAVALVVAACGTGSEEAASGGVGSGIGVHGAWTLDVYDADGSLDRTVHFDNGLVPGGAALLAEILAGQVTPGSWVLGLGEAFGEADPCTGPTGQAVDCVVQASELTVEIPSPGQLVLSGATTIENSTTVGRVSSSLYECSSSVAPADCAVSSAPTRFTFKSSADDTTDDFEPVPVTAGQTVHVTVELTFGTLP